MLRIFLCLCCVSGLFGVFGSSRLHAQLLPGEQLLPGDKAAAQGLLEEARRLVDQRHYATACSKLEASHALDPAAGTLLTLADCYEKTGRTASAWSTFRETASAARRASDAERERIARERAKDLQPGLSYLTVITWKGQDIEVARDGSRIDSALIGTAIPVDPGAHQIMASAPGKRSWSTKVNVRERSDRVTVSVPILAEDPTAASAAGPVRREATDTRTDADYPMPATSGGGVQRAFALVAAALGVAGVATGTVFGLKASSTMNEAKAQCTGSGFKYPNNCSDSSVRLSDDAVQSGQISTVGFISGGAGVAAFALLWLTAPSSSDSSVSLALAPLALDLKGRF
jgi:serine/threonine-protein kinase